MSGGTFPGSKVRHGTKSGYNKHYALGETSCLPCFEANRDQCGPFTKAHGVATQRLVEQFRNDYRDFYEAASLADEAWPQNTARANLRAARRDVYAVLYAEEKQRLGITP